MQSRKRKYKKPTDKNQKESRHMKKILGGAALLICIIVVACSASCHYVYQGEKAFYYDVSSGKAVNPVDNPLLPIGFNSAWGINKRFFRVLGTMMDYDFTKAGTGSSPYNETLEWNSLEGVHMAAEYKLWGRVTDPWLFFLHFGDPEHDYKISAKKDIKVYEALRFSGKNIAQHLNEYSAVTDAEDIRTHPDILKQKLLEYGREYMKEYGFELTDLLFIGNFQYPDGNVINEARQQLTSLDSEIRSATQNCSNKLNQVKIDTKQASIEANNQIAEAKRKASTILAESSSLAAALKQSVEQVGIDWTMRLKMADLYSELTQAGAMPTVVVTEDSIFAAPFYPAAGKGTNVTGPKVAILPERLR